MERNGHFWGTKGKIPSVLTYAADYVMNFPHMEFSKLTGLGIHTLRYYEQEGLLEPKRNSGNRRRYSDKDLAWIRFIKRLKDTGMPIREIRHYAQLRSDGDPTLSERMEMLARHRQALNQQIARLQDHKNKLEEKIEFYRKEIERVNTRGARH